MTLATLGAWVAVAADANRCRGIPAARSAGRFLLATTPAQKQNQPEDSSDQQITDLSCSFFSRRPPTLSRASSPETLRPTPLREIPFKIKRTVEDAQNMNNLRTLLPQIGYSIMTILDHPYLTLRNPTKTCPHIRKGSQQLGLINDPVDNLRSSTGFIKSNVVVNFLQPLESLIRPYQLRQERTLFRVSS